MEPDPSGSSGVHGRLAEEHGGAAQLPQPAGPVGEGERIGAMDSARGFALLGILLVNMDFFSEPLGRAIAIGPKSGATGIDLAAGFAVAAFCEGKFFTLFSLLFGMGLTIQFLRASQRGERFGARGVRRLLFLAGLGLMHGLLLWYGDILFFYGICGLVLLACIKFSARTLAIIAGVLLGLATLLSGGFGALSAMGGAAASEQAAAAAGSEPAGTDTAPSRPWDDPSKAPFSRLMLAWDANEHTDPTESAFWQEMETLAYREGPASSVFVFRALTWGVFQVIAIVAGFSAVVLGMFALGASLLKAGVFEPRRAAWWPRMAVMGLGFGLPSGVLAVWLMSKDTDPLMVGMGTALNMLAGIAAATGVIGLFAQLVRKGVLKLATDALANAGRMAMTNYLTQTLVMTGIFYWWGLGKFGTFNDAQKVGLAVGLWTIQLGLSALWLSRFRMGPMEWLWRCGTYLKAQPFVR